MASDASGSRRSDDLAPKAAFYNDPKIRGYFYQAVVVLLLAWGIWSIVSNTIENLQTRNIAQGFGFLDVTAGFDLSVALIDYPKNATYGRAILVGIVNTLVVAVIGIFFATLLGFIIGVARLSKNFVIQRLATGYVETIRNLPLLLQLFFWYFGVLSFLPNPRDSLKPMGEAIFINNRGFFVPEIVLAPGIAQGMLIAAAIAVAAAVLVRNWAKRRQDLTGKPFPVGLTAAGLVLGLPLLVFVVSGAAIQLVYPVKGAFNVTGARVVPEFIALLLALTSYTAAFIAEIVRAGIMAVSHGQTEAARSLGLSPSHTLRLVVIPQAMRVIIPPLTSQYLNLTKNSSLAVAVGYPDLVYIGGTVLNQTGQSVEVVAIWMLIYLTISVATSAFMNWYNRRVAIVER
ncbi:MAG: amino acid ABC transporter permease [Hyphomicrobiaceae bacterium]|nr:amino acid ABC transporter permease [Hyphomicrobiaceae bacterium]